MNLLSATFILFLVMNPLGNLPIFLATLKPIPEKRHKAIIIREVLIAMCVLIFFMFCGQYLLQGFQITAQALGIAGGIIMFLISLRMIFPPDEMPTKKELSAKEPFFVPLAVPLTAGPAAMATVMLFVTAQPDHKMVWLLAIVCASLVCGLILLSAPYLSKFLGEKGLIAMERLMGMLLIATAVQMFLSGLTAYFQLHT